jgi:hypothetical protein
MRIEPRHRRQFSAGVASRRQAEKTVKSYARLRTQAHWLDRRYGPEWTTCHENALSGASSGRWRFEDRGTDRSMRRASVPCQRFVAQASGTGTRTAGRDDGHTLAAECKRASETRHWHPAIFNEQ